MLIKYVECKFKIDNIKIIARIHLFKNYQKQDSTKTKKTERNGTFN